jgi:DNA-binding MarR family transcriptional regulator
MTDDTTTATARREALAEHIGVRLRLLIARALVFNHQVADHLGLHPTDNQCLGLLELEGEMTPSKLAARLGLSRSATTAALDRLERAGFAHRTPDAGDRRQVIVRANQERLRSGAAPLYASRRAHLERLWPQFTDEELAIVARFFQALTSEADESVAAGAPGHSQ